VHASYNNRYAEESAYINGRVQRDDAKGPARLENSRAKVSLSSIAGWVPMHYSKLRGPLLFSRRAGNNLFVPECRGPLKYRGRGRHV
jgi:hypothetical protein